MSEQGDHEKPAPPVDSSGRIDFGDSEERTTFQWHLMRHWWTHQSEHDPSKLLVDDRRKAYLTQHDESERLTKAWVGSGMAGALEACENKGNNVLRRYIKPEAHEKRALLSEVLAEVEKACVKKEEKNA